MQILHHRLKKAMAAKRIDLMDIRQLLRLKLKGKSNRSIAQLLHISRNTVNSYIHRLSASEHSLAELLAMDDTQLSELFPTPGTTDADLYEQLCGYFPTYQKELAKPGCTLLNLWQGYISKHADGYKYTQFVHHFRTWQNRQWVSGKLEHKAGEKLYVDFCGKKLSWVDPASGEVHLAEVFVAILPASQYTFVRAVSSQSREDFIAVMAACLSFLDGVPEAIVSDNRT